MKLNLGSGHRVMPGWINVDRYDASADMDLDLFLFPWPWGSECVDVVAMHHFLEHFRDPVRAVQEVHRILKPGGEFWVRVPHAFSPSSRVYDHKQGFTSWTIKSLCGGVEPWIWDNCRFVQTYLRVRWVTCPGFATWTPLDWWLSRFLHFFEKFVPIRPAEIEWKGRKALASDTVGR